MPYISQKDRRHFAFDGHARTVGELTYALTKEVTKYLEDRPASFAVYAEALAALEAARLEFYRRVVAPYEDAKIREHGDVYPTREAVPYA